MNVLGIDPGQKGGLAVVGSRGAYAVKMPMVDKEIDIPLVRDFILAHYPRTVVVEEQRYFPKQGRRQGGVSTFTTGRNYGELLGCIKTLDLPLMVVPPKRWQKALFGDTDDTKAASIAYVRRLYPDVDLVPQGCRVAHDGMADALCLATYGTL